MTMTNEQRKRMKKLIVFMNRASYAYYNSLPEIISNYEYDAMEKELVGLEEETGFIYPISPTQKTGSDYENIDYEDEPFGDEDEYDDEDIYEGIPEVSNVTKNESGNREAHEYPARSLPKSKDVAVLQKWSGARPIWISWKLDGLTIVATYDKGKLTKIMTRGNGLTGTNITYMAGYIKNLPKTISYKGHMVVRGEATISYTKFDEINELIENVEERYANPRNLASGTLGLDETRVDEVAERGVSFNAFTLVHIDERMVSWGERMNYLEKLGFVVVEREATTADMLPSVIEKWTEKVTSGKMDIPVDGLVIVYDDTDYAATGSVTGHHATNAGFAFKWQDKPADSILRRIEWSCAVASISPVAIFDEVELEGTRVSRASLCNISEIKRLKIGANNKTKVKVIKANMIIPKIISADGEGTDFEIPKTCPVCGTPTVIRVSDKTNTETLHCSNPKCTAKMLRKFERFVSKPGVDIDGLSIKRIAKFINMGFIKDFADIYSIASHKDSIVSMEGFGEKSYKNLIDAVEKSRNISPINFIYALCIPLIGVDAGKRIIAKYGTNGFIDRLRKGESFEEVEGIGPEKSSSIINWYKDVENSELFNKLIDVLNVEEIAPKEEKTDGRCNGLTFVITGDVFEFKNRNEFKAYVESEGGKVTGSVSKKTDYLVNNDVNSTSGKNKDAKKLGIPIISEKEFIEKFK